MTEGHVTNLPSPLHQHPDLRGQDPLGQGGVRETQLAAERGQRERQFILSVLTAERELLHL